MVNDVDNPYWVYGTLPLGASFLQFVLLLFVHTHETPKHYVFAGMEDDVRVVHPLRRSLSSTAYIGSVHAPDKSSYSSRTYMRM